MEKLSFLLVVLVICFVEGRYNFRDDDVVLFNGSAKCPETNSAGRGVKKEIVDFFDDVAVLAFQSFSTLPENSKCRMHMELVHEEARRLNFWALKLLDASAKLPSGILSGNLNQFGDFDECLSSEGYLGSQVIQGKYCLANIGIKIDRNRASDKIRNLDAAIHSNWILHNEFNDQGHRIPKFETFNVGVCVPAACVAEEVEAVFNEQLKKMSQDNLLSFEVFVSDEVCYVEKKRQFSVVPSIVRFVFLLKAALIILGTLVDMEKFKMKDEKLNKIFICFSLKRNFASLIKTSSPQDDIKCIHGARFLNAVALLLSHKQIAMLFNPILNRTQMSESFSRGWTMIGRAAILYTDSFILFSGLLISYSTIKDLDNKKSLNFKDKLIGRITRLLPNLLGVILFCTFIMEDAGSGPQWGLVVSKYTNLCKKYMWRNFLFIHNYFGFENMCLTHTHQLGIDMQLFLMSPVFIWIIWKMPKMGTLLLVAVSTLSTWLRYDITYRERLSTLLYYGISVERLWKTANMSYILPAHRLTVYLIGIILGYYLRRGGQHLNFSFSQATVGWILALAAGLLAVFGPYQAAFKEYVYNVNDAARFNAFAPILWTAFISWGILACLNGCGGFLNDFLSWKYFAIFTKISYAVYLTQFPVFFYIVGTERTAQYFRGFHSLFDLEELSIIFIASVVLTLTFDIPFQELRKALKSTPDINNSKRSEKMNERDNIISKFLEEDQETLEQKGRRRLLLFGSQQKYN